jgi:hypothetical protein
MLKYPRPSIRNTSVYAIKNSTSKSSVASLTAVDIGGCIQKFRDWPPGTRTTNGTAFYHYMQLYRYFVSQSSEFCCHNHLCCFSTSVYFCRCLFRYRLSPETFGYTLVVFFFLCGQPVQGALRVFFHESVCRRTDMSLILWDSHNKLQSEQCRLWHDAKGVSKKGFVRYVQAFGIDASHMTCFGIYPRAIYNSHSNIPSTLF